MDEFGELLAHNCAFLQFKRLAYLQVLGRNFAVSISCASPHLARSFRRSRAAARADRSGARRTRRARRNGRRSSVVVYAENGIKVENCAVACVRAAFIVFRFSLLNRLEPVATLVAQRFHRLLLFSLIIDFGRSMIIHVRVVITFVIVIVGIVLLQALWLAYFALNVARTECE